MACVMNKRINFFFGSTNKRILRILIIYVGLSKYILYFSLN